MSLDIDGRRPLCRKGQFCSLLKHLNDQKLTVFGGSTSKVSMLNDLWFHSVISGHWAEVTFPFHLSDKRSRLEPENRWKGSFTTLENNSMAILFGGSDVISPPSNKKYIKELFFNDVWAFDSNLLSWRQISQNTQSNDTPRPRRAHAMVYF